MFSRSIIPKRLPWPRARCASSRMQRATGYSRPAGEDDVCCIFRGLTCDPPRKRAGGQAAPLPSRPSHGKQCLAARGTASQSARARKQGPDQPGPEKQSPDRQEAERQSLIRLVERGVGLHIAIQAKKLALLIAIKRNQSDHGSIISAGRKRRHSKAHAELMAHSLISVA